MLIILNHIWGDSLSNGAIQIAQPVIAMNVLGRRKAGAVGKVLNGVTVHILDSEGNPLPVGEEGEICCR